MSEHYLTRRTFLLLTAASTPLLLFNSCANAPSQPTSPSSSQSSKSLSQIPLDTITPARLGVNIHLSEPVQNDAAMISQVGIGFVRVDFSWSDIERKKGNYDFSTQEELVKVFADHGIQAVGNLAYNNPLYDTTNPPFTLGPHTDEVRQAFARFAAACVQQFKDYGVVWEIWNEPNNPNFWRPIPSATDYMALAKSTIKAMRQVDAHANIIAPALITSIPASEVWNYLQRCLELGLLDITDALSIHPYRDKSPETVVTDYQHVRTLMTQYAPHKKNFPIVSSEWGYPILSLVSGDEQAALLVRQFLINCVNGILLSIWYDWHDDGQDANNPLDNFGILTWKYQQKPAYAATVTLMKELNGFRFIKHITQADGDYIYLFAQGQSQKLVVWTDQKSHSVNLPITTSNITLVSMTGARRSINAPNGELTIEVTSAPQYVLTTAT